MFTTKKTDDYILKELKQTPKKIGWVEEIHIELDIENQIGEVLVHDVLV